MSRVLILLNYLVIITILVLPGQILTWHPLMSLTVLIIVFFLHFALSLGVERISYERKRTDA